MMSCNVMTSQTPVVSMTMHLIFFSMNLVDLNTTKNVKLIRVIKNKTL